MNMIRPTRELGSLSIRCVECCRRPPVGDGPHQETPFVTDEPWYQARCHACIARHGFHGRPGPVSEPALRETGT